jgi:hypothetical protein
MAMTSRLACRAIMLLATASMAGCARDQADRSAVERNLGLIGVAYSRLSANKPPRSAEDLKPTLKQFGNPDELLVSPNDGQPYTIRWEVRCFRPGPDGANPVLAHESIGAEGKKYVLDNMLHVQHMTEAELQRALRVTAEN